MAVLHQLLTLCMVALLPALSLLAADTAEKKITFDEHIKPIFREHCTACHSESDKSSDLALDSYAGALAGGSSGRVIAEGNSDGSRLFALVTHAEQPFMPPDQDAIAKEQIALLKTWIEQGMPENSGSKIKRSNTAAAAMLSTTSLGKPEGPPPMPASLLRQAVVETERSAAISAMAASPWAPLVAVGGQAQVCCYHSETGELLGVIPFPEGIPQSLTFTRDGKQLLIGGGRHSQSGCAVLVDVVSGERIAKVGDELDTVLAADISPDKKQIALAGPQRIIRIFDTFSGELQFEMKKHTDWVFALRYSPDGVLLASGDRSNGLIVWEADTARLYAELSGHKDAVRGLDFRPDSNVLVSASLDGTLKLWDMFESKEIKSWAAHAGGTTSVAYAQNGLLASAGRDAAIKLWNGNGELQKEFQGLGETALEVAITGDAAYVAGGDWQGRVQVWPAADPQQTKLIVANPPSIETRLQQASAALAEVQAEFAAAQAAAKQADVAQAEGLAQLTASQAAASTLAAQLSEAKAQEEMLAQQAAAQDAKIQQLQAQLTVATQARQEVATQAEATQQKIAQLTQQSQTAAQQLTAAQAQHEQWSAAAEAATKALSDLHSRLQGATEAANKAAADKAEVDARAAALEQRSQQTANQVKSLSEQLSAAVGAQETQQADLEKMAQELQVLSEQMATLQKKLQDSREAREQAAMQLSEKEAAAAALKKQRDAAEQSALEAQQQWQLFREAYGPATVD
ncbi:MAG: hypothetical protein KDA45_05000 [Planctomycetales bacterium]|nr:hypothetical protein [Planctomycetales bacterium]